MTTLNNCWLYSCGDLACSGQRVSDSRYLEDANGLVLLAGLSCPPLLGSFQRLLGPGSMSVLQETPPSWLLSAGLHLHERGVLGSPSGLQFGECPHEGRGRTAVSLKHHRDPGPGLILSFVFWLQKWNIKHLSPLTFCSSHSGPHAVLWWGQAFHVFELAVAVPGMSFPSKKLLSTL